MPSISKHYELASGPDLSNDLTNDVTNDLTLVNEARLKSSLTEQQQLKACFSLTFLSMTYLRNVPIQLLRMLYFNPTISSFKRKTVIIFRSIFFTASYQC